MSHMEEAIVESFTGGRLPPDDVVVAALRAGDEAMFATLLDTWSRGMLWLARSHVSTNDSAEEVVQDTWLAVIKGIDGFEGRSSVKTWIYRILVNTARKRGVRENRTVPWSSVFEQERPTLSRVTGSISPRSGRLRRASCSPPRYASGSGRHWPNYPPDSEP
jgi:DNA-directed RNA polymerase specialized sigma24 family protein